MRYVARTRTLRKNLEMLKSRMLATGALCGLKATVLKDHTTTRQILGQIEPEELFTNAKKVGDLKTQESLYKYLLDQVDEILEIDNAMRGKRK
jgi:hypothetical protein